MIWIAVVFIVIAIFFGIAVFRGSPYVPSHRSDIRQAFHELYPISNKDTLVDIGSGDGVVLREASKIGANAFGFEINPLLIIISRLLSWQDKKVRIILSDYWFSHLPIDATVIYTFSASRDIKRIKKWTQKETNKLGRSIYLISYGSKLSDMKATKSIGAYHLYKFYPLQTNKAQV